MNSKKKSIDRSQPKDNSVDEEGRNQSTSGVTQLSILDLFIWITFSAAVCAANQAVRRHFGEFGVIPPVRFTAELIAYPAGLTALMLAVKGQLRHRRQELPPGVWLLCLTGVSAFFYLSTSLILVVLGTIGRGGGMREPSIFLVAIYILRDLATLLGIGAVATLLPVRSPWRWFAFILFLFYLPLVLFTFANAFSSDALLNFSMGMMPFRSYLLGASLMLLIGLAIWDHATTRDRRDWLHWLGIAIVLQYYVYLFASQMEWA